ncbi:hypothetical protein [Planococcus lenghuensis]|uniref:hypothetical protein n=1 Tax=Planococcus lenghuensis TaxID=2213202 RepID=UPI0018DB5721|nr:hypothetical protein [Planococcus lenghuensis]
MRELLGSCTDCGKDVYCMDGFLNGVYIENRLFCFECADPEEKKEQEKEQA